MPNWKSITSWGAVCTLLCAVCAGPANAQLLTGAGIGGTYVRGDVGWSWARDAQIVDKNFGLDGLIYNSAGTGPGVLNDIGDSYVVGVGVGARISDLFRGEIVYSYRGGYELSDTDQFGDAFGADITSHSVMANAYWDIPFQMAGFAPFVGAGVGWAGNHMKNVITEDGGRFLLPEGTVSNLAWQAMAGVAFAISPQATVDLFYRYFDGGNLQTEAGTALFDNGTPAGPYTGMRGELAAHEIVVSLRWALGP